MAYASFELCLAILRKSYLGKRLANINGMGFIDIDRMIEYKYNMKLSYM